jgi:ADP-ribose pyrophosphatase YjhB (NUDIX family)
MRTPKYCHRCGKKLGWKKEDGKRRHHCPSCRIFVYENPLPVAAVVCVNSKKEILLIRRAQEPSRGKWALPSGFIELHESPEHAALRELREETGVKGKVISLLGVFARSGTFYKSLLTICYLVRQAGGRLRKTPETLDCGFFPISKLKPIIFKTHKAALKRYLVEIQNKK